MLPLCYAAPLDQSLFIVQYSQVPKTHTFEIGFLKVIYLNLLRTLHLNMLTPSSRHKIFNLVAKLS